MIRIFKILASWLLTACLATSGVGSGLGIVGLMTGSLVGCTLGPGNSQVPLNPIVPVANKPSGAGPNDSVIGFDQVYSKVFEQSCQHCHGKDDKPIMGGYADYKTHADEIFRQVVLLRKMPKKKPLSEEQIALVKLWIDQGAQELSKTANTPPTDSTTLPPIPTPTPTPAANPDKSADANKPLILWQAVNSSFFEKKCTSCHFSGNKDGLSNYEDLATVRATIGTIFYTTVISPVMPPPPKDWDEKTLNPNQLSRDQKDILSQWIIDGMK